ncbi:hypothetical protein AURDEDRAFT_174657 [Auricularia subglabra TFB-10046 SS5]|uniref:Uncharacterized protein n=1 Tax=Auricularia subglabra (strain TFB-10046 / SS5) TaxID=717982 RepID=J0WSN4_AURST|nr:hypothetical protein AURDEDRAFT_174657 [Auricularia subglabra TFB-10046 SS5]
MIADRDLIHPLRTDESTGEPYLQLPAPYAHIVLTPQRLSDAAASVKHMNDPRVYMFITGPPLPYLEEHALAWIRTCTEESESALAQLCAGARFVDGCPVRVIRDISNSSIADAPLIGDCGFGRHGFGEMAKTRPVEAKQLEEANMARKTGDPGITWTIGGK